MLPVINSHLQRCLYRGNRICHLVSVRMAGVFVRNIPDEDKMQISVVYAHNGEPDRTFNLQRPKSEEIGRSINRLQQNILKAVSKKKKKKSKMEDTNPNNDMTIDLLIDGNKLEEYVSNSEAWVQGAELVICDTKLPIDVNLPAVKGMSLPSSMMAGFPIFPKIDLEFSSVTDCTFKWYRTKLRSVDEACSKQTNPKPQDKDSQKQFVDMQEVSCDIVYTPRTEDIGYYLMVECTPKYKERKGKLFECVSKVEVSAGPGLCPFENRQMYTQLETEDGSFRVVSYNILADLYADSDFSRTNLYPYCPPYALSLDYRTQLLLKEIAGYQGDIICLQECDRKVFERDLLPAMEVVGRDGWLKVKGGQIPEGSATFYNTAKFRMISQHDVILTEFLKTDPVNSDLWEKICSKDALKEKMENRSTALQITILQSTHNPTNFLCVANTHFYFHPKADNIRTLQIALSVRYIEKVCQPYKEKGDQISLVFCGDFNSSKKRAVNVFMTTGYIPEDFDDWTSGGEDEKISYSFSHDFKMESACGYVDYTNYTAGFSGQLDYIFTDTVHLEVKQVIPMPDHEEVTQHVALPSVVFPSDHIALICEMKWKSETD